MTFARPKKLTTTCFQQVYPRNCRAGFVMSIEMTLPCDGKLELQSKKQSENLTAPLTTHHAVVVLLQQPFGDDVKGPKGRMMGRNYEKFKLPFRHMTSGYWEEKSN